MSGPNKTTAYLGLGGNLGDPKTAMAAALRALDALTGIAVVAVSSLYRTPPWGMTDQPDFLNAVAKVETALSPRGLLDACLDAERALKRVRNERWGPRSIDLDILIFGDRHIDEEGLSVPHPRIAERAFVLVPLAELAPNLTIAGRSIAEMLDALDASGVIRLNAGNDWWKTD